MAEKEKEAYQERMKKFMYISTIFEIESLKCINILCVIVRDAHPDYILPKSKQTAKAVPPKPPTPFKLFSDEKIAKLLAEGMTSTEARFDSL